MVDKKQLVLVVEGNAALGPYWHTIVSDYLLKVIRSLCGDEATEAAIDNVELALVQFTAHGSYNSCLVQRSGWIRNVDCFLQCLSAMQFSGGGFCDAAIAEGLAEVLMMFSSTNVNQNQQDVAFQRHCILVSASNPYLLPTAVYRPSKSETKSEICLSDAETLAKSFPQCFVSLSVICPRQLPKLKSIYKAGKRDPSTADPTINVDRNPHYIVLISENFKEACTALGSSEITSSWSNQSPSNMEVTSVSVPPTTASVSPVVHLAVNESMLSQQSASVGNISPVTAEGEPSTVSSVASPHALQHVPPQGDSSLQICSSLSTSQELISSNDNMHDLKPAISGMQQPLRPANVSILNNLPQARLTNPAGTSIGGNLMVLHMSNMISGPSGGMASSSSSVPVQTVQSSITSKVGSAPLTETKQHTNVGLSQQTSSTQQSGRKYVKAWEGDLVGERQGQTVLITRLECYRSLEASSESLAEDWPSTLVINKLISENVMDNKKHIGKAEYVVFRAMNDHGFLGQLQEKKLTLLLSVSDVRSRLIGMVFPRDMVELKPHIPEHQPSQSQLQQRVGTGTSQGTGGGRKKSVRQRQVSSPGPKA